MAVLMLILPLALILVLGAVLAFVYAVRKGQFDDLETPAIRMLFDDVPPPSPSMADSSGPKLLDSRSDVPPDVPLKNASEKEAS